MVLFSRNEVSGMALGCGTQGKESWGWNCSWAQPHWEAFSFPLVPPDPLFCLVLGT